MKNSWLTDVADSVRNLPSVADVVVILPVIYKNIEITEQTAREDIVISAVRH